MNTQEYLQPPLPKEQFTYNNWFELSSVEPTVEFISTNIWESEKKPQVWQAARLSQAVYIFREIQTKQIFLVKYYSAKVGPGPKAEQYAQREYVSTRIAETAGLNNSEMRVPHIYSCVQGTLVMEYVVGFTLEDIIAVRRSRPGVILSALQRTANLLARLHICSDQLENRLTFQYALNDVRKYLSELFDHGVLKDKTVIYEGIQRLLIQWEGDKSMVDFPTVYVHGDATTSNFVFLDNEQLVAIDWERLHISDPALDLGRLMAEVSHSVTQHGGNSVEAEELVEQVFNTYCAALPSDWDTIHLTSRVRFYRACSTFRIARNGWIPRQDRLAMVAQAMALLVR